MDASVAEARASTLDSRACVLNKYRGPCLQPKSFDDSALEFTQGNHHCFAPTMSLVPQVLEQLASRLHVWRQRGRLSSYYAFYEPVESSDDTPGAYLQNLLFNTLNKPHPLIFAFRSFAWILKAPTAPGVK